MGIQDMIDSAADWVNRTQPLVMDVPMVGVGIFDKAREIANGFCTVTLASKDRRKVASAKAQLEELQQQQKFPKGMEIFSDPNDIGYKIMVGFKSDQALLTSNPGWSSGEALSDDALGKAAKALDIPIVSEKNHAVSSETIKQLWQKLAEVIKTHLPQVQISQNIQSMNLR